jgi:hypothetical protein
MENVDWVNQSLIALGQSTITALTDDNENARRCNSLYETVRNDLLVKHPWNFAIKRATLVDITKPDVDLWVTATDYVVDDVVEFNGVHYTCLIANTSTGFAADLAVVKWVLTTDWVTATSYAVGDHVYNAGVAYTCLTPHTSGVFATDLTAVKWILSVDPEYDYDYAYRIPTDNLRVILDEDDEEFKIEGGYLYSDDSSVRIKYIAKITDPDEFDPAFLTALVTALAGALALAITNNRNIAGDMKAEAVSKKLEAIGTDAQGGGTPDTPKCNDWINSR